MLDQWLLKRHLEEEEVLKEVVHKHWLTGIKSLCWPTVVFLFLWVFLYQAPFRSVFLVIALASILTTVWWLRNFFDYYLDAWIITDQAVIDLAWHGWFHRQSTRVLYSDIQGVSYEIYGVLGTVLGYGTVNIEKISTGSMVSLDHVPQPRRVEALILKSMEAYLHTKNLKDARHVQEILADFVATQVQIEAVRRGD